MRRALVLAACLCLIPPWSFAAEEGEVVEAIEWDTPLGRVSFPHRMHVDDLGMACADCHHETAAAHLEIPHPEYLEDFWIDCGTCHQTGVEAATPRSCSSCHHGSPVTIADETLSAKVVIHRSCWACHEVSTGAEASRSCPSCHQRAPMTGDGS